MREGIIEFKEYKREPESQRKLWEFNKCSRGSASTFHFFFNLKQNPQIFWNLLFPEIYKMLPACFLLLGFFCGHMLTQRTRQNRSMQLHRICLLLSLTCTVLCNSAFVASNSFRYLRFFNLLSCVSVSTLSPCQSGNT